MDVLRAHNVRDTGVPGGRVVMFAHGFGCDQHMWRYVAPYFEASHRVILFDHVGSGGATAPYDVERHASLDGYAEDVVRICAELELDDVVFVGHSVSAMVGVLAQVRAPERFSALALVGPSPRYINDDAYTGGFEPADIDDLLSALSSNYLGWSSAMAPVIMGNPERPELGAELTQSFCRTDPDIAERFARATFLSDNRSDLPLVTVPTLVMQCRDDLIAPMQVGQYVADAIPDSSLVVLEASGHCPNLSAPNEVIKALDTFLTREP
ncbi:alpha/beta hydrolase [Nocardioides sp. SYSU D00065]|uniref:alpha/beta fold hydrolase n=1 Tax=Nocardioides sp. SYSU D00065 TaxID=2817378 RepID=UPI0027DBD3B3|nr:alpha/beta hydrolase [Nocardioides sp. SYSU D00065]